MNFSIRRGTEYDLVAIGQIQGESSWKPADYLGYDFLVAEANGEVVGFLVSRTAAGETEILNIAVDPSWRRQSVATILLQKVESEEMFLEVRESNKQALELYRKLGFSEYGKRHSYYENPREDAVLMRLSSSLKRVKS